MDICLLVSGNLGFQILQHVSSLEDSIKAVFTDSKSEEIIAFCLTNSIPTFIGNPRKSRASLFIKDLECDVLLSVNYLFLIEEDIIKLPKKYAINIHGSLLPKYRGRTPHVWAIINGEKYTGITAHLIEKEVDNGDIIEQLEIEIGENDTGGDILQKFNILYIEVVNRVLQRIKTDQILRKKQDSSKATYFGKRTPESGKINWLWCKDRIRNWIRAQARPYPGAYTFLETQKIVIHKAEISDLGFRDSMEDGTILEFDKDSITVKCANGSLKLSNLEFTSKIILKKGDVLI